MEDYFEWDFAKAALNVQKHGVDFETAKLVFKDKYRRIFLDIKHSQFEARYFCVGKVAGKIIKVRFVYRQGKIRIFGAGFWREGRKFYEKKEI